MNCCDFSNLAAADAKALPFPHVLCPGFIREEALESIHHDFPEVPGAGSFPTTTLKCKGMFAGLVDEIRSTQMADMLAEKLEIPLSGHPTMVTVRGFCRKTDGKIHRDSGGKLVTVLLYLNRQWDDKTGGRLRLLNGSEDINDYFLETPPGNGTLLAFRCDENAWHGHQSFAGERRALQLNWVVGGAYQRREAVRHFFSATLKKARAAVFGRPA